MILSRVIKSKMDRTIKFVFKHNGQEVEFSYIDNYTDKDIICVPCQTMCNMSCDFCYLTKHVGGIKSKNIESSSIFLAIKHIWQNLGLSKNKRPLLISFMGSGEPMDNIIEVIDTMKLVREFYTHSKFAISTIMPKKSKNMESFNYLVQQALIHPELKIKLHLSLHYTEDDIREVHMPSASRISESVNCLRVYGEATCNEIEVHYILSTDTFQDDNAELQLSYKLGQILATVKKHVTVKFMAYSDEQNNSKRVIDSCAEIIVMYMKNQGFNKVEYYKPPGNDIGSGCGQFIL